MFALTSSDHALDEVDEVAHHDAIALGSVRLLGSKGLGMETLDYRRSVHRLRVVVVLKQGAAQRVSGAEGERVGGNTECITNRRAP